MSAINDPEMIQPYGGDEPERRSGRSRLVYNKPTRIKPETSTDADQLAAIRMILAAALLDKIKDNQALRAELAALGLERDRLAARVAELEKREAETVERCYQAKIDVRNPLPIGDLVIVRNSACDAIAAAIRATAPKEPTKEFNDE